MNIVDTAELLVTISNTVTKAHKVGELISDFDSQGDPAFVAEMNNYQYGLNLFLGSKDRLINHFTTKGKKCIRDFLEKTGTRGRKKKKTKLVIYGPTPLDGNWIQTGDLSKINVGSISTGKKTLGIILETGRSSGHGGRFIGFGQKVNSGIHPWFRMDWHNPHGKQDYILPDDDLGNYHMHISKACGGKYSGQ